MLFNRQVYHYLEFFNQVQQTATLFLLDYANKWQQFTEWSFTKYTRARDKVKNVILVIELNTPTNVP